MIDLVQRQSPHLLVVPGEEAIREHTPEGVAIVLGQIGRGFERVQVVGPLLHLCLYRSRNERGRVSTGHPHCPIACDRSERHLAAADGIVEVLEVAVDDMAAQVPGESVIVRVRCGHPTHAIRSVDDEVFDASLTQAHSGTDPCGTSADDQDIGVVICHFSTFHSTMSEPHKVRTTMY